MVKNYLVSAVRPISNGWHLESSRDLYKAYQRMYEMSLASWHHFCQEPFEAVCWTDEVRDNEHYTIENWRRIYELAHSEPCNIFWAGADTLMIQPTSIFSDRFREYRLFNYTDPKSMGMFEHYYNNDLQYFPHTMKTAIWELGEQLWEQVSTHPDRNWGFDQIRNNIMFWTQPIPDVDRCHPKLAYQCLGGPPTEFTDQWNGIPVTQAHILHFHGSRGSARIIETMQKLCEVLEIRL